MEEVRFLSDSEIEEKLFPQKDIESVYLEPDYSSLSNELTKKDVTKKIL